MEMARKSPANKEIVIISIVTRGCAGRPALRQISMKGDYQEMTSGSLGGEQGQETRSGSMGRRATERS